MKIIRKAMLMSIFLLLAGSTNVSAATRWNAFLMGDSIIDGYPHEANGLAYYLKQDSTFSNVYDYSFEGSKVCTDGKYQTRKVIKKLADFRGKNNLVVISMGTNDYFKEKDCIPNKLFKKRLKEIKEAYPDTKFLIIIPTHIYRVRNDARIRSIYNYQETDKELRKFTMNIKTGDYLSSSDIKADCLHFTSNGYKKTVAKIKEMIR